MMSPNASGISLLISFQSFRRRWNPMPFAIEPSTEIAFRHDFALLANARGYVDAVEVGVDQGVFAKAFLDRWRGSQLMLVDPYRPYPEMPYDRTLDGLTAIQALMPHHGRWRLIRDQSPEAIQSVMRFITAPEFVYIDGSHEESDVIRDLLAWWEVIPPHGLMAGHDFNAEHPGVTAAVEGFARERELVVRLTHETTFPASWMIYRTEPEKLFQRLFTDGETENPYAARAG
jgi:hypothetical protein